MKLYLQSLLNHLRSESKRLNLGGKSPDLLVCSPSSHPHQQEALRKETRIRREKKIEKETEKVLMMRKTLLIMSTLLHLEIIGISAEDLSKRRENLITLSWKERPPKGLI